MDNEKDINQKTCEIKHECIPFIYERAVILLDLVPFMINTNII